MITGRIEGLMVTFFSIYAPPGIDWTFYKKIFDMMSAEAQGVLICGGDMNIRLSKMESSTSNIGHSKPMINKMNSIMKEIGIVDVWREFNPTSRDYTYFSTPQSTYSRIDYFFAFKRERLRIRSCDIGTIDVSDHAPIVMTVDIGINLKSTLWKLNSSLLNNPQVKELEKAIDTYFKENNNGEVSPPIVWGAFKAVLRGKIISISSSLKNIDKRG